MKIYILIAATIVFVAVGYFRFFYKKPPGKPGPKEALAALEPLQAPEVNLQKTGRAEKIRIFPNPPDPASIRDLFKPFEAVLAEEKIPQSPAAVKPAPALKLRGVIVGGQNPLAIINDRFVRKGDRIDGLRVVSIETCHVRLVSSHQQLVLKLVEDE